MLKDALDSAVDILTIAQLDEKDEKLGISLIFQ